MHTEHQSAKTTVGKSPQLNEVALVKEDELPRGLWKLAEVMEFKKGVNNRMRLVSTRFLNVQTHLR